MRALARFAVAFCALALAAGPVVAQPNLTTLSLGLTSPCVEQTAAYPLPPRDLGYLRARHHYLGNKPGLLFTAPPPSPFRTG